MVTPAGIELLVSYGDIYGRKLATQPGKKHTVYPLCKNPDVVDWVCCLCGQMFSDETSLTKHKFTKHGLRSYCCKSCGNYLPSKESLMSHMEICHRSDLFDGSPIELQALDKPTDVSGLTLFGGDDVYSNIQTIPESISKVQCADDCHASVVTCSIGTHSEQGKGFRRKNHTGDRPYMCTECGKRFRKSKHLKVHMRIHTGERPYTCTECGKAFAWAATLKTHMRTHTGERPYTCTECGKGFTEAGGLKKHMRIHTGERPYTCTVCGKGFVQTNKLKIHMRIHTGERPYTCSECGNGFADPGSLKRHMRIHTGERPYMCTECGKGFIETGGLKRHMETHTGERPYTCMASGKEFTQAGDQERHMITASHLSAFDCHKLTYVCMTN